MLRVEAVEFSVHFQVLRSIRLAGFRSPLGDSSTLYIYGSHVGLAMMHVGKCKERENRGACEGTRFFSSLLASNYSSREPIEGGMHGYLLAPLFDAERLGNVVGESPGA